MNPLTKNEVHFKVIPVRVTHKGIAVSGTVEYHCLKRVYAIPSVNIIYLKSRFTGPELLTFLDELRDLMKKDAAQEKNVLNLTQHAATQDQLDAGVVEPMNKGAVQEALTFSEIPRRKTIIDNALALAYMALDSGCNKALIGGAPFLMSALEKALMAVGVEPLYSFSIRSSVEESDDNGGVKKTAVFKHAGFISAQ